MMPLSSRKPFDEEIGSNLEVGIKGFFFDRRVSWNASAFYQLYEDFQVNVPDPETTLLSLLNAAEVVVTGFDMDFTWLATERLTLDGNIAYTDSRFDEFENAGCIRPQYAAVACLTTDASPDVPIQQDLSDKRLSQVSPWTANINATWDDSFDNGIEWYLRGEYAFRDDRIYMYDLDPASTAPSYSLWNASFGLDGRGWFLVGNTVGQEPHRRGLHEPRSKPIPQMGWILWDSEGQWVMNAPTE